MFEKVAYEHWSGRKLYKEKIDIPSIDIRGYAKFVFKEGTNAEKRGLLECLKSKIYLANKKISLDK